MIVSEKRFWEMKEQYRGFYQKFNTEVIKWNVNKIFNYNEMINSAKNFLTFEDFYGHYTKDDAYIISHVKRMYEENKNKYHGLTEQAVLECLLLRIGNNYSGNFMENKIINILHLIEPWVFLEKTDDETDRNMKVDAILTLAGIDQTAVQIKPISFKGYGMGSETDAHKQFKIETNMDVHYLFYKDSDTIVLNGHTIKLFDKERLVENIVDLVYSI